MTVLTQVLSSLVEAGKMSIYSSIAATLITNSWPRKHKILKPSLIITEVLLVLSFKLQTTSSGFFFLLLDTRQKVLA